MPMRNCRGGFTWVELLVIVAILVVALAIALPAIMSVRESNRRAMCTNNMKQLGLAFHNYHTAQKRLPPSSTVTRDATGEITAVDGWSYAVFLLPFLGEDRLYKTLDVDKGRPLTESPGARGSPHAQALATTMPSLLCPVFHGSPYVNANTKAEAITNYKAMGATHIESLSVASPNPLRPKYDPRGKHPDGACFPGDGLRFADFGDGTGRTILLVESVEQRFARWTVGAEAAVVGLPPVVEFARMPDQWYYAPAGFVIGMYEEESCLDPSYRTYLNWDYEQHPYDGGDGSKGGKFGPSSHHTGGMVNHLFADGGVRGLKPNIDVALYFFLITRDGGDPASEFFASFGPP